MSDQNDNLQPTEADLARDLRADLAVQYDDMARQVSIDLQYGPLPSTEYVYEFAAFALPALPAAIRRALAAEAIIAQHDLCRNLHGQVDARAFADGCTAEQRKLYGCAPDADEVIRLRAMVESLSARVAAQSDLLSQRAERGGDAGGR